MHIVRDRVYLCSGTMFGRGSSFRAARILSKTINAILFRLSHVLYISVSLIERGLYVLGTHMW